MLYPKPHPTEKKMKEMRKQASSNMSKFVGKKLSQHNDLHAR
jgi:hypothetical protein